MAYAGGKTWLVWATSEAIRIYGVSMPICEREIDELQCPQLRSHFLTSPKVYSVGFDLVVDAVVLS